jgi:hypothetical protein
LASAIEEVAYIMAEREQTRMSYTDWVRPAGKTIRKLSDGVATGTSPEEAFRVLLSTGLLQDFGGDISFVHRSFLEFLAARRIVRSPSPAHADPVALQMGVARFVCSGMADVTDLFENHLNHSHDVQVLLPLLREAANARVEGGRFHDIYDAIVLGQQLGQFNIDWCDESDTNHCIDTILDVCIQFEPQVSPF